MNFYTCCDIINSINIQIGGINMAANIQNNKGQKGKSINNSSQLGTTRPDGVYKHRTEKAVNNPVPGKGGKNSK